MIIASTTAQLQRFQTGPLAALLAIQFPIGWFMPDLLAYMFIYRARIMQRMLSRLVISSRSHYR